MIEVNAKPVKIVELNVFYVSILQESEMIVHADLVYSRMNHQTVDVNISKYIVINIIFKNNFKHLKNVTIEYVVLVLVLLKIVLFPVIPLAHTVT